MKANCHDVLFRCTFNESVITSVVPGDFDGDALMDVLVTTLDKNRKGGGRTLTSVHIIWGGATYVNCSNEKEPVVKLIGQPVVIDYNQDMIIDLFGQDERGERAFWVFNSSRGRPERVPMRDNRSHDPLRQPHSHAYLGRW